MKDKEIDWSTIIRGISSKEQITLREVYESCGFSLSVSTAILNGNITEPRYSEGLALVTWFNSLNIGELPTRKLPLKPSCSSCGIRVERADLLRISATNFKCTSCVVRVHEQKRKLKKEQRELKR